MTKRPYGVRPKDSVTTLLQKSTPAAHFLDWRVFVHVHAMQSENPLVAVDDKHFMLDADSVAGQRRMLAHMRSELGFFDEEQFVKFRSAIQTDLAAARDHMLARQAASSGDGCSADATAAL